MPQTFIKSALLTSALVLTLSACGPEEDSTSSSDTPDSSSVENAVAFVNGKALSETDLNAFIALRQQNQPGSPVNAEAALQELVSMEALRQQAEADGLHLREDVKSTLERQRSNLLINTMLAEFMDNYQPSEEEMKATYEEQMGGMDEQEYKASHILVDTEDSALALIEELKTGADFAELAREHSTGPSSVNGGDLGWFNAETMVAPFAEAVRGMQAGSFSETPTQTEFGFHVIYLEDVRPIELPPFEAVKEQVAEIMTQQALREYIDEVRAAASVEIPPKP